MTNPKVERCRYCGIKPKIIFMPAKIRFDKKTAYWIECDPCHGSFDNRVFAKTKSEAIKLWNEKQKIDAFGKAVSKEINKLGNSYLKRLREAVRGKG